MRSAGIRTGVSGKGAAYIQLEGKKEKKGGRKAVIISLIAVAVILILVRV